MHGAEVAIDDMRLVDKRVLFIESEELLGNIDIGVAYGVGIVASRSKAQRNSLSKMEPGRL